MIKKILVVLFAIFMIRPIFANANNFHLLALTEFLEHQKRLPKQEKIILSVEEFVSAMKSMFPSFTGKFNDDVETQGVLRAIRASENTVILSGYQYGSLVVITLKDETLLATRYSADYGGETGYTGNLGFTFLESLSEHSLEPRIRKALGSSGSLNSGTRGEKLNISEKTAKLLKYELINLCGFPKSMPEWYCRKFNQ